MPQGTFIVLAYGIYLAVGLAAVIAVGRALATNGRVFLVDGYRGNEPLAAASAGLFATGFHTMAYGFLALWLRSRPWPTNLEGGIELAATNIGQLLMVLAGLHFGMTWVFTRIRAAGLEADAPPPVAPDERLSDPLEVAP